MSNKDLLSDIATLVEADRELNRHVNEQMSKSWYGDHNPYRNETDVDPRLAELDHASFALHDQSRADYEPDNRLFDMKTPQGLARSLVSEMSEGVISSSTIYSKIQATLGDMDPAQATREMLDAFSALDDPRLEGGLRALGVDLSAELLEIKDMSGAERTNRERELLHNVLRGLNEHAHQHYAHNMTPGQYEETNAMLLTVYGPDDKRVLGVGFNAPEAADRIIDLLYNPDSNYSPEQRSQLLDQMMMQAQAQQANPELIQEVRRRIHRIEAQTETLEAGLRDIAREFGLSDEEWKQTTLGGIANSLIPDAILDKFSGKEEVQQRVADLVTQVYGVFNGSTKSEISYILRNFQERNGESFEGALEHILPRNSTDEIVHHERESILRVMNRGYDPNLIGVELRTAMEAAHTAADTENQAINTGFILGLLANQKVIGFHGLAATIGIAGGVYYNAWSDDVNRARMIPIERALSGLSADVKEDDGRASAVRRAYEGLNMATQVHPDIVDFPPPTTFLDPTSIDLNKRAENFVTAFMDTSEPDLTLRSQRRTEVAAAAFLGLSSAQAADLQSKIHIELESRYTADLVTARGEGITDPTDARLAQYPSVELVRKPDGTPEVDASGLVVLRSKTDLPRHAVELIQTQMSDNNVHVQGVLDSMNGFDAAAQAAILWDFLRGVPGITKPPSQRTDQENDYIHMVLTAAGEGRTVDQFMALKAAFVTQLEQRSDFKKDLQRAITMWGYDSPYSRTEQLQRGTMHPWRETFRTYPDEPANADRKDIFSKVDSLSRRLNPLDMPQIRRELAEFSTNELAAIAPALRSRFAFAMASDFDDRFGDSIQEALRLDINPWKDGHLLQTSSGLPSEVFNILRNRYTGTPGDVAAKLDLLSREVPSVSSLLNTPLLREALIAGMPNPWVKANELNEILSRTISNPAELSQQQADLAHGLSFLEEEPVHLIPERVSILKRAYQGSAGNTLEDVIASTSLSEKHKADFIVPLALFDSSMDYADRRDRVWSRLEPKLRTAGITDASAVIGALAVGDFELDPDPSPAELQDFLNLYQADIALGGQVSRALPLLYGANHQLVTQFRLHKAMLDTVAGGFEVLVPPGATPTPFFEKSENGFTANWALPGGGIKTLTLTNELLESMERVNAEHAPLIQAAVASGDATAIARARQAARSSMEAVTSNSLTTS